MTGDADLSDSDSDSNGEIIETDGFLGDVEDVDDERMMTFDGDMGRIDPADSDVVELNVQVDVSDMDDRDKQVLVALANQFEDCFTEVVKKNRKYGFAFLKTGNEIARRDGGQFENAVRATANGLYHRTGDKRSRFYEMMFTDTEMDVDEPLSEAARENGNYWLLMSIVTQNPELVQRFGEA